MENRDNDKQKIRFSQRIFSRIISIFTVFILWILLSSSAGINKNNDLIRIVLADGKVIFALVSDIAKESVFIQNKENGETTILDKKRIVNIQEVEDNFFKIKLIRQRFGYSKKIALNRSQILSAIQEKLLDQSYKLIGYKPNAIVNIKGQNFKLDCIGTISAIFYSLGMDIRKDFGKYRGNGVSRLFQSLKDHNAITSKKLPDVGDLIFWDNTWDKNGNGIDGDDPLTHVGIVVKVDDDATVHYLHENYVFGVMVERMNLYRPTIHKDESGKIINSAMYAYSSQYKHPVHWLSGDLWKIYGTILSVKEHYQSEQ